MIVFYTLFVISSSKYLLLEVFGDAECSHFTRTEYSMPLPSFCSKMPFDEGVEISIDEVEESVLHFRFFSDHPSCSSEYNTKNITRKVNTCVNITVPDSERIFYFNLSVTDSDAIDISQSKSYIHNRLFLEPNCIDPWTYNEGNYPAMLYSNFTTPNGEILFEKGVRKPEEDEKFLYALSFYCTDTTLMEEFFHYNSSNAYVVEGRKRITLDNGPGSCIDGYGETYGSESASLRTWCWNDEEFDEYLTSLPSESPGRISLLKMYYDQNCTQEFFVRTAPLDLCLERQIKTSTDTYEILYKYRDQQCTNLLFMYIRESKNQLSDCVEANRAAYSWQEYIRLLMVDEAYYPNFVGMVVSERENAEDLCDEEIVDYLEEIKEDPRDYAITYMDPDYCIDWIKYPYSLTFTCNQGELFETLFSSSRVCQGPTEESVMDYYCMDIGYPYFQEFTFACFPYFCFGYSEYNHDQVCSGRGTCVGIDVCDCDSEEFGYGGEKCDTILCFGIEQDNSEEVCSNHGTCVGVDDCDCDSGFSGTECSEEYNFFGNRETVIITFVSIGLVFTLILCLLILCCYFCVCCVCLCCCCIPFQSLLSLAFGSVYVTQKRKINTFSQLDDFYILLENQKADKESGEPKFKIRDDVFIVTPESIKLLSVIGTGGSQSTVYLCRWASKIVAFKSFRTHSLVSSENDFDEFERESTLLASVSHPNILRFYGCCLKQPRIGFVMEYAVNGDLSEHIRLHVIEERNITRERKMKYLQEIATGMSYLHSKNIIHRDLKPENVLLDESHTCKIMDFGVSRMLEGTDLLGKLTRKIGTSIYMAPEIVISERYDNKVDVFSYSILAYVLITMNTRPYGRVVSRGIENSVAYDPNLRPVCEEWENDINCSPWVKELVKRCWDHSPERRHSFEEILKIMEENDWKL